MPDKSETFRPPTVFDFQRNLDAIIHSGEREARTGAVRTQSQFAAKGLGMSGPLIGAVTGSIDKLHGDILERAMKLTHEFTSGSSQLSPTDLAETSRSRFESFATMLLSTVPPAGSPQVAQRVRDQYAAVFQQRLDGALRDIEIGFVGGSRLTTTPDIRATTKLSDAVILKPTFMGMGLDLPKAWKWVREHLQRARH